VELVPTSSFEGGQQARGKTRLLRRVVEAFRQTPRRDQVGYHQPSSFFKRKFASSNMEVDPFMMVDNILSSAEKFDENKQKGGRVKKMYAANGGDAHPSDLSQAIPSTQHVDIAPIPQSQLRSLSSISAQSEFGERAREARSEHQVTRRTSYCSDREGIEEEREPLEPKGNVPIREAME